MKSAPQSKLFSNAEPLRVPIADSYPDELHQCTQQIGDNLSTNQKREFNSYTKIGKLPKMIFGKIKVGCTRTAAPWDP